MKFYVAVDLKQSGSCRTTSSIKPLLYMTALVFGYQKNSPITKLANQGYIISFISKMFPLTTLSWHCLIRFFPYAWQMGYVGYITRKYFPVTQKCRVDIPPKGKTSSLKLADVFGAFALLGIGTGISILVFLIELIFARPFSRGARKQKVRFGLNITYSEML